MSWQDVAPRNMPKSAAMIKRFFFIFLSFLSSLTSLTSLTSITSKFRKLEVNPQSEREGAAESDITGIDALIEHAVGN
jgi:hypothetical protein